MSPTWGLQLCVPFSSRLEGRIYVCGAAARGDGNAIAQKDELIANIRSSGAPYMEEVEAFAYSVSTMAPVDEPVMVPVAVIRFTHHTVNAELAFGEDHENRQESIFKSVDGLFRGDLQPRDLALDVFLHDGPDVVWWHLFW